jgi:hypothetical protein
LRQKELKLLSFGEAATRWVQFLGAQLIVSVGISVNFTVLGEEEHTLRIRG